MSFPNNKRLHKTPLFLIIQVKLFATNCEKNAFLRVNYSKSKVYKNYFESQLFFSYFTIYLQCFFIHSNQIDTKNMSCSFFIHVSHRLFKPLQSYWG